jgi:hypothetical protein
MTAERPGRFRVVAGDSTHDPCFANSYKRRDRARPGQNISKYSAISHALASAAFPWAPISERFIITR